MTCALSLVARFVAAVVPRRFACAAALAAFVGCAAAAPSAAQTPADAALAARVEAVLASASDVPADSITVQVRDGVVIVSGSVLCDGCGGRSTPGGTGTVQQSLGAVVRAVPGVDRVEFRLRYAPS
jgi:hypothetical protein